MGHFQPLKDPLGIFSSSFIDSWHLITGILKPMLDKDVTEILTHKLPQQHLEETPDMLGEYSLQAGDKEEDTEGFVTRQHSSSRILQGKKPAVSLNLLHCKGW